MKLKVKPLVGIHYNNQVSHGSRLEFWTLTPAIILYLLVYHLLVYYIAMEEVTISFNIYKRLVINGIVI
jgi:hypothetical protein